MKRIHKTAKIWQPVVILDDANHNVIVGPDCMIGQFAFIAPRKLTMERGAEICPTAVLGGGGEIYMCKYSCVDYGAKLIPATFSTDGVYMNDAKLLHAPDEVNVVRGSITLGEGSVVGSNAVVCVSKKCPNIEIGEFSVVGAGSYIDKDVPKYTVIHPSSMSWKRRVRGGKKCTRM